MATLKNLSRILIVVAALLMVVPFFVPVWQILMWAPQYPEGLEMKIWLHTLSGDYKIISGLNHYIGMKHIDTSMFPEFGYMRIVVAVLIGIGLIAALVNRRFMLWFFVGSIVAAGTAGMVDFYLWGYDYGHNLDPTAPIIVPGMAYQPPLIGTKQLLNFTAYSGPDTGGWFFFVAGLLAVFALVYELRSKRRSKVNAAPAVNVSATVLLVSLLASCSVKPEPLQFGKDGCYSCKMTLADKRFGAEIVTKKGKVFKFDDTNCMASFHEVKDEDVAHRLVVDFGNPGQLIDVSSAFMVRSDKIRSPMNGQVASFSEQSEAESHRLEWDGTYVTWEDIAAGADEHHSHE